MQLRISTKHVQIDKAQSRIMGIIAIATVVTVFCLTSSKVLISQAAYQRKVIESTNAANEKLESNAKAAKTLVSQYQDVFQGGSSTNVLGGDNRDSIQNYDNNGNLVNVPTKPPDGSNARIVLDALPTSYDYPALLTSVMNILKSNNVSNPGITGTDQTGTTDNSPSPNPQSVSIPLDVTGSLDYKNVPVLLNDFERSIRPFDIGKLSLVEGDNSVMTFTISMNTYFLPAKALTITQQGVK